MECPKCGSIINDNSTVCPTCKKVIALKCPNCNHLGNKPICENCGYSILVKCAKCSKLNHIEKVTCSKCGFSLPTSLALQECESDEFASIIVEVGALKKIKKSLNSQELYSKFLFKLKNLLYSQLKGVECKVITYGNTFTINLNKELSLATSSNKAIKLALKIINSYVSLNSKIMEELGLNLNLTLTILKKQAEELQDFVTYNNNLKILTTAKKQKKYLKGLQIVVDQYIWDEIQKNYKTDSLYTIEDNGKQIMFYEVILDSYVLPPEENSQKTITEVTPHDIKNSETENRTTNISYNNFEINTKGSFYTADSTNIFDKLDLINFHSGGGKIISIKAEKYSNIQEASLFEYFNKNNLNVLRVNCSELLKYKPWGFFIELFKEYFNLPFHNNFIDINRIATEKVQQFKPIFDLILEKPIKSHTPEDARYAYLEIWCKFLSTLKDTVIIIDNSNLLDDTSIQTLKTYFDKFKKICPSFVFVNNEEFSLHSKMKNLIQAECYSEIELIKTDIESCLSTLKSDATDFIQSFYYEKIKSQFKGSYLYFYNAIEYLKESGVLIDFENKLLLKNNKSIVIPTTLDNLIKARIKNISQNQELSLVIAYTIFLGGRLDLKTLEKLGIKDIQNITNILKSKNFIELSNNIISFNNYGEFLPIVNSLLKTEAKAYLAKNILTELSKGLDNASLAYCMKVLSAHKEQYLTLWKNSHFAIKTGDYDTYLKNCIEFLSLLDIVDLNITEENLNNDKKDIYKNIHTFLYAYVPEKIYDIANILLSDAVKNSDNENIIKISNLMLQGAIITANHTDAQSLLHNILSRIPNPKLIVDGAINSKFLLLSLVNVEILYNLGDYKQCTEIMESILDILQPEVLEKVKPINLSLPSFVTHIQDSSRYASFAKLHLMDENLEEFFTKVEKATGTELPEKDCILAIKDFIAGKAYTTGNIEEYSPYSKIIFLILQEFNNLEKDYKKFAQNIYQAKLLAQEIHQKDLDLLCDLFIGYAYSLSGEDKKANKIYEDVKNISSKNSIFFITILSKYLMSQLLIKQNKKEDALILINECLKSIRRYNNKAKILFALFENLYINTIKDGNLIPCDVEAEKMKLLSLIEPLKRLLNQLT